jgi:hypothetical protein
MPVEQVLYLDRFIQDAELPQDDLADGDGAQRTRATNWVYGSEIIQMRLLRGPAKTTPSPGQRQG